MERRVKFHPWQKVTHEDAEKLGLFPQESFDHYTADLLIPDTAFAGLQVIGEVGGLVATCRSGGIYVSGKRYYNDDEGGVELNFLTRLPTAARRYVAVVGYPNEVLADTEPRTFLTDVTTRATIARVESTEMRRRAEIGLRSGDEGPDPTPPAVAANEIKIADVLLDTEGIVSIRMARENRAPSLREADTRLNEFDVWRVGAGTRLDTLESDLIGLAARLNGTAQLELVIRLIGDVAEIQDRLQIPDAFTNWSVDHFVSDLDSDLDHIDTLARVEEGVRFAHEARRFAELKLVNTLDPLVSVSDNFLIPAFSEVPRIESLEREMERSISSAIFVDSFFERSGRQRGRLRHGRPYTLGRSWLWLMKKGDDEHNSVIGKRHFMRKNSVETFNDILFPIWIRLVALKRRSTFWNDHYLGDGYWRRRTFTGNSLGSKFAQTFRNSQPGWLTSVDLIFTRRAVTGDVTVSILAVTEDGEPDWKNVLARTVLPRANIVLDPQPTNVPLPPTFLTQKAYALMLESGANHYIGLHRTRLRIGGTLFQSTDGGRWGVGNVDEDMCLRLNFAKFLRPRTVVNLEPVELNGGIGAFDLIQELTEPPGTKLTYQVFVNNSWRSLDESTADDATHPFNGLPPLAQLRAVMEGSVNIMPGFGIGEASEVETWRPRPVMRHVSKVRTLDSICDTVYVDLRVSSWRGAPYHTLTCRMLTNLSAFATPINPTTTSVKRALDDRDIWVFRYMFDFNAGPVSAYRIRLDATTDNVLAAPVVDERVDIAVNRTP